MSQNASRLHNYRTNKFDGNVVIVKMLLIRKYLLIHVNVKLEKKTNLKRM